MGGRLLRAGACLLLGMALSALVPTRALDGGGRTLEGWGVLVLAGAAALVLAAGSAWRRCAGLSALFLLGGAAQLALTQPLWLQYLELRPGELTDPVRIAAIATLAFQAIIVPALLRGRRAAVRRATEGLATPGRIAGAVLLFVLSAAHVSLVYPHRCEPLYLAFHGVQLLVLGALFWVSVGNLFLAVAAAPDAPLRSGVARLSERVSSLDPLVPWLLMGFVLVVSGFLARVVLDGIPHVPDGVAYLFQAKCFAAGRLSFPAPPVPEAFSMYLVEAREGRWLSVTNPGWPAVLAVGEKLGAPWLVNPVIGALSIPPAHAIARRLGGVGMAHGVALLLATSPWLLFLSASYMTEPLTLLATLAGCIALLRAVDKQSTARGAARAFASGAAMGVLFLVRPLNGILLGALGAAGAARAGGKKFSIAGLGAYGLGCVASGIWLPLFNRALTGDAAVFPINRYLDELWYPGANRMGFGSDVGNPPGWSPLDPIAGHGWRDVLLNLNQNLYNGNFELFGWCIGSLALAALHVLIGRHSRADRAMLALLLTLVAAYSTYWFSGGPDFGPRYWYLMIFPAVWLTARGGATLHALLAERFPQGPWRGRLALGLALLLASSLGAFLPYRAVARYHDYRDFHDGYHALVREGDLHGLVLVQGGGEADYASAFLLNRPDLEGPVFARDLGEGPTARLLDAFPGRPVHHVRGRTGAGPGPRILDP